MIWVLWFKITAEQQNIKGHKINFSTWHVLPTPTMLPTVHGLGSNPFLLTVVTARSLSDFKCMSLFKVPCALLSCYNHYMITSEQLESSQLCLYITAQGRCDGTVGKAVTCDTKFLMGTSSDCCCCLDLGMQWGQPKLFGSPGLSQDMQMKLLALA